MAPTQNNYDQLTGPESTGKPPPKTQNSDSVGNCKSPKVPATFFILRSLSLQDLELSSLNGIWATQTHKEEALNKAYEVGLTVFRIRLTLTRCTTVFRQCLSLLLRQQVWRVLWLRPHGFQGPHSRLSGWPQQCATGKLSQTRWLLRRWIKVDPDASNRVGSEGQNHGRLCTWH